MTKVSPQGGELHLSHDDARRAAAPVLEHPGTEGIEVVVAASRTGLTRYANSEIIQNTRKDEVRAYVRAVVGERAATAATTQLDPEHMRGAAEAAAEAARASRADAEWPGLADPDLVGRPKPLLHWDEATAACSVAARAGTVAEILDVTRGARVAGVVETSAHVYSVISSTGVDCYDAYTRCIATCLVDMEGSTGWGEASSRALGEVDAADAARRGLDKARAGIDASDAAPGVYQVVLEPPAVAALLEYLAYAGFGAKQVIDGDSFLSSRTGEAVADASVTLSDDAGHPRSVGIGFDLEGVPKRRVAIIDSGRAASPVTDLRTASKLGVESTGHYSGSSELGPYASNVVFEPGGASMQELIAGVDEGLLVTRFHYVNILDRPGTLLTGMTRDGTFRIHGGEVGGGVHNLRFTESVLAALASTQGIGRELEAFAPEFGSFGSTVAPAVRLGKFHFTSATTH